ncbi:hypothetical protein Tco_0006765 [Tanacetum coccineum]
MMVHQDLNQVVETLLVIVDEQLVLDMIVDEQLVLDMIANELVLNMVVVMEEMCRIVFVEELLKTGNCTKVDCIEVDDCCSMELIKA